MASRISPPALRGQQLAQEKITAARACLESSFKNFIAGRGSVDGLYSAAEHLTLAELQATSNADERVAILERQSKVAAAAYEIARSRAQTGQTQAQEVAEANYLRIQALQTWQQAVRANQKRK